mmetsp:Transcript_26031/g.53066  ORF Transcript_26031/g.53066 Transcript_26031/m.53066 type:complete len:260 (-) Transcript_26031:1144-1923(-)
MSASQQPFALFATMPSNCGLPNTNPGLQVAVSGHCLNAQPPHLSLSTRDPSEHTRMSGRQRDARSHPEPEKLPSPQYPCGQLQTICPAALSLISQLAMKWHSADCSSEQAGVLFRLLMFGAGVCSILDEVMGLLLVETALQFTGSDGTMESNKANLICAIPPLLSVAARVIQVTSSELSKFGSHRKTAETLLTLSCDSKSREYVLQHCGCSSTVKLVMRSPSESDTITSISKEPETKTLFSIGDKNRGDLFGCFVGVKR